MGAGLVEILSIRHGRTAYNAQGVFMGATDVPLDDVGRTQAAAVVRHYGAFPLAGVATSPLARARQTGALPGRPVALVPGLREMHVGALEGLPVPEAASRFGHLLASWRDDPTDVAPPGGETLGEARDRALNALHGLASRARPGGTWLVVSHQLVLSAVAATLDGASLARWREYASDHTCGWRLLWRDGAFTLDARLAAPA